MSLFARLRRRWSRWDTLLLLAAVVILAGAGLPLPGYALSPGRTADAADLIVVKDQEVFEPEGTFLVSTVALRPLSPFLAIHTWLDDSVSTVPKDEVQGKRAAREAVEESETAAIAVALQRLGFEFPVDVRIAAGGFQGGSAGLALTLGLLDVLTPGELTGRNRVAVTGTIAIDGSVGKVGSVTEKAVAARRAGARYFLVPSGQVDEAARGGGQTLKVIAVNTLDDALTALEGLGGDVGAVKRSP